MILQLGVKPSWFNTSSITIDKRLHHISGTPKSAGELRSYIIDSSYVGDVAVSEMLLKVLEPYRQEGAFVLLCLQATALSMNGFLVGKSPHSCNHCIFLSYLGCILDDERARLYAKIMNKGSSVRLAFAAMIFGESAEALFWLQLPRALNHLINKSLIKQPQKNTLSDPVLQVDDLTEITSCGKTLPGSDRRESLVIHTEFEVPLSS